MIQNPVKSIAFGLQRASLLLTACALVMLLMQTFSATSVQAEAGKRPNIVLILADDLGFSDLGCYGGEIATPNLDSIADNGLRFTQFYNTARCWPTRGSLLTGYYAQQIRRDALPGIPSGGGNRGERPDWAVLIPQRLKAVGYRSYHTGKWHIDGMPIANGFDHSYYLADQGRFFNPQKHWKDDVTLPPVEGGTDFYATTALADHVIEVLGEHQREHGDSPFFHYLAFAAPHFPLHALPEDIAIYKDLYQAGWDSIRQQRWQRMRQLNLLNPTAVSQLSKVERELGPPYHFPDALKILGPSEVNRPMSWDHLTDDQKQFQANKMAIHAAMIHRMDIEIGRVFDQIKKMGQWDNTLIIFLSDNGASAEIMVRDDGHDASQSPGSAGTYLCLGPGWSTTCNTPFRRHKTWTHEGGIATPFIMSWPQGIAAHGELRNSPRHVIDVAPTLLELAGATAQPSAPASPGKSLVPLFDINQASDANATEHESIWWFHDGHKAIRMGDWKAVAPIGQPWELYNLAEDRVESNDLAIVRADKLSQLVDQWNQHLNAHIELATQDLSHQLLNQAKSEPRRSSTISEAQAAAQLKRHQYLINGETFMVSGRHAFVMRPKNPVDSESARPWIFYGPTLAAYPDQAESWMHQQFLDAGIAVAGIDVGEAYGSPHALPHFDALYDKMVADGYSTKPALLGRSRGGLWVSSWAISHPGRVAAIGGIYPVYDYTTYPGVKRAASAYGVTQQELIDQQDQLNPIRRADVLAKAKIPVLIIHGTDDKVVPIQQNSLALQKVYQDNAAADLIVVHQAEDQGHSFWPGFFHHQPLVDFLIKNAN